MRVLVVTSQVTFMPKNYRPLLRSLAQQCPDIVGLVTLKNYTPTLTIKALALMAMGAPRIGLNLFWNTFSCHFKAREKDFVKTSKHVQSFTSINEQEAIEWIQNKDIDIILNLRTRCIYRRPILQTPKIGCINLHHGRLPKDRGTMCDLWALSEQREAGFSLHHMTEKIDDGKILKVVTVDMGTEKNYQKYLKKTHQAEFEAINELLNQIKTSGELPAGSDNSREGSTYYKTPGLSEIKELKQRGMVL